MSFEPSTGSVASDVSSEQQRIAALSQYEICASPPDGSFDRITALAAELFRAPMAVVSFVGEDWQWFKSTFGFTGAGTPRQTAFCDHTIRSSDVFEVCDTQADERFSDNPLAVDAPYVRYYAGAPLILATGERLGALCILDRVPRKPLAKKQRQRLQTLAQMVGGELDLQLATRRLELAQAAAEAATRAKDEFLGNMSHELRTPLTSIMGYAGLLKASDRLPADLHRYSEKIWGASQALRGIVSDVLEIARLEAGSLDLMCEPTSARQIAQDVLGLVADQAHAKNLSLSLTSASDVPPVAVDPARLRQVLLHLASNAVKFTSEGGVTLRVRAEAANCVEIDVIDSGIGIPTERLSAIFEHFAQADSSTAKAYGGTGLGLSIAKRLVNGMGGELRVRSTLGQGSTFSVSLPIALSSSEYALH